MRWMLKANRHNQKGQAMVELALVLPILLLLLLGIMEFGRISYHYLTVHYAAREGARTAALGGDDTDVLNMIYEITPNIAASAMTITIQPANRVRGDAVTVTVTSRVDLITPFISKLFPSNPFPVTGRNVMRVE